MVPHIFGIAVLITAGNTLFLAATRVGSTSVAAVLTSLFPAVTVFWAWMVFREPLRAIQVLRTGGCPGRRIPDRCRLTESRATT